MAMEGRCEGHQLITGMLDPDVNLLMIDQLVDLGLEMIFIENNLKN